MTAADVQELGLIVIELRTIRVPERRDQKTMDQVIDRIARLRDQWDGRV